MEDFVLLATVDGQIHARDRDSGDPRWSFSVGRPMVETTYDYQNISENDPDGEIFSEMPLWIVEPSQNGNLYVYSHGSSGIQKLGMTVRDLAEELSPYAGEDPPVVYTAEKKSTLYTVDAQTGHILKRFSSGGSSIFNNTNCEPVSDFASPNNQCKGTLTLGQTEYVVAIQSRETGRPICTIRYFEWTPNLRDRDLHAQYLSTMDNKYVYSKYDGTVFALDHTTHRKIYPQRPVYTRKLSSPVVRVFDVARPYEDESDDPALIILPQPIGPAGTEEVVQDVWVNCTETGTWYAMSEFSYPSVTDGASVAKCYSQQSTDLYVWDGDAEQAVPTSKSLVGVHSLASHVDNFVPDYATISAPIDDEALTEAGSRPEQSPNEAYTLSPPHNGSSWLTTVLATLLILILVPVLFQKAKMQGILTSLNRFLHKSEKVMAPVELPAIEAKPKVLEPTATEHAPQPEIEVAAESSTVPPSTGEERRVRFAEPEEYAKDDDGQSVRTDGAVEPIAGAADEASPDDTGSGKAEGEYAAEFNDGSVEGDGVADNGEPNQETPKKKKAHRGQRGGRKRRKNTKTSEEGSQDEISKIVEEVKTLGQSQGIQPDVMTSSSESITDIASNIKRLGKLTIFTDKVIGNGSGGTFVFEGKWKVRVQRIAFHGANPFSNASDRSATWLLNECFRNTMDSLSRRCPFSNRVISTPMSSDILMTRKTKTSCGSLWSFARRVCLISSRMGITTTHWARPNKPLSRRLTRTFPGLSTSSPLD